MDEGELIDGRYKVESKLGQGGMGQVFRGYDIVNAKTVAIKVLFPNTPDQVIKRFHTEAKALAKFNHPNIMKVEHFGQASNGQLYLINEFVEGDSLSDLIATRGPQTFFDVLPIFEKICRGLRYAHMQKVLHRDIKPSNVMLAEDRTKEDSVKLVDFGLAKPNDEDHSLTKTGTAMGSPPYMSPEAVHGNETDERSDIYSLGCTLFEMMAAVPPFVGDNPFHTMMAQINRQPPTLAEACDKPFDEEVEAFVQKFIEKNPADRFQNMDEVIAELERVKNALNQKKQVSEGWLASGLYASGNFIAERTRQMNTLFKRGVVVLFIGLVVAASVVYSRNAFNSAPKATVEGDAEQTAAPEGTNTPAIGDKLANASSGHRTYNPKEDVIRDKNFPGAFCCLFSGELSREEVKQKMEAHKDMTVTGLQFEEATLPDNSMHYVLGFPFERVNFVNTKVTADMMKYVGFMKQLKYLRIFDCGDIPQGSLDYLKNLKTNSSAFMKLDLACGKAYKQPAVPFAGMPMLVHVRFERCTIAREDMKALAGLKNMQVLHLKYCTVTPDALEELKASRSCAVLLITDCEFTAKQFQQIGELDFLRSLHLNNTNLDDANLLKLKNLKNLIELNVQSTQVNPDGGALKELKTAIPTIKTLMTGKRVRLEE